jgi:hypothetical protein
MEQETGVSQRSPSQNSYLLRYTDEYCQMGAYTFAKVTCKIRNFCGNFCKVMLANH